MEISEVRIKLVEKSSERLRAFCSITLDSDFVIRDLKIIDGASGPFVAMPSRKLADRCPRCGAKNHLRAKFCNDCGAKLNEHRAARDGQGRAKLHADVAHPINAACRERIQNAVIEAYEAELERSREPGYKPARFDDDFEDDEYDAVEKAEAAPEEEEEEPLESAAPQRRRNGASFEDYNSLIAELRTEAEERRERRGDRRGTSGHESQGPVREGGQQYSGQGEQDEDVAAAAQPAAEAAAERPRTGGRKPQEGRRESRQATPQPEQVKTPPRAPAEREKPADVPPAPPVKREEPARPLPAVPVEQSAGDDDSFGAGLF